MTDDIVTRLRHGDAGREEAIAEIERLRAALEQACDAMDAVTVFVTSRERIQNPHGEKWWASERRSARDALAGTGHGTGHLGTLVPSEGTPIESGYPDSDGLPPVNHSAQEVGKTSGMVDGAAAPARVTLSEEVTRLAIAAGDALKRAASPASDARDALRYRTLKRLADLDDAIAFAHVTSDLMTEEWDHYLDRAADQPPAPASAVHPDWYWPCKCGYNYAPSCETCSCGEMRRPVQPPEPREDECSRASDAENAAIRAALTTSGRLCAKCGRDAWDGTECSECGAWEPLP